MSISFKDLNEFPKTGILALKDESNKSVYCMYSHNTLVELCRIINDLQHYTHKNKDLQDSFNRGSLELEICRNYDNVPFDQLFRAEYEVVVEEYKSKGYRDLRQKYIAINYRVMTRLLSDYRKQASVRPLVYVLAKTTANANLVMAIFDSIPDADAWVAANYPNKSKVMVPKFHDNELTKGYHDMHGIKLVKLRYKRSMLY